MEILGLRAFVECYTRPALMILILELLFYAILYPSYFIVIFCLATLWHFSNPDHIHNSATVTRFSIITEPIRQISPF